MSKITLLKEIVLCFSELFGFGKDRSHRALKQLNTILVLQNKMNRIDVISDPGIILEKFMVIMQRDVDIPVYMYRHAMRSLYVKYIGQEGLSSPSIYGFVQFVYYETGCLIDDDYLKIIMEETSKSLPRLS